MRHIILILSLFLSFGALAGESTYICEIKEILELSDNGDLVKHNGVYKSLIGEKFTIDRDSGEMIGLPFSTKSYKQVTVLDKGSKEMSFKSIVLSHPPNRWVMYIQVKEFAKGKLKPFWGTEGGNMFSGQCE
jgi:hypothetical protein